MLRPAARFVLLAVALGAVGAAQDALPEDRGAAGLSRALKELRTTASVLHITAHPDDEDGGMLATISRGQGGRTVLLTLNRGEAGALSGRLAALTGQHTLYSPFHWKRWLGQQGRSLRLDPAFAVPGSGDALEPALLASIDAQRFADLEAYISSIDHKPIDLAIVIDCTASMSGELAAAQGGIDDLMLFIRDVASENVASAVGESRFSSIVSEKKPIS